MTFTSCFYSLFFLLLFIVIFWKSTALSKKKFIQSNQNRQSKITRRYIPSSSLSMSSTSYPHYIRGISEISDKYDGFIIDQWGVLHDGKKLYPGAKDTMIYLKNQNKKCILLSNSSKRKENSINGLKKVGLDPSIFFHGIVTSGEVAWHCIKDRNHDIFTQFMKENKETNKLKVFVFGNNQDDDEYCQSCNCELTNVQECDFVLARGTFRIHDQSYEDADELMMDIDTYLKQLSFRRIPMLVSNPDFYRPGSVKSPMPGLIAEHYKYILKQVGVNEDDINQLIYTFGKPCSDVYNQCFTILNSLGITDKERICGVGDSLEHDIIGANTNHVSSCFIENGVHSSDFDTIEGSNERGEISKLENFFVQEMSKNDNALPTHTVPNFST